MKRKFLFIVLVIGIAAMASAQGWGGEREGGPPSEAVTVTGTMTLANGIPAIKSGDVIYIFPGLNRIVGYMQGLQEGASVTIDGTAISNPNNTNQKFVRASKLTVNGNTHDLTPSEEMRSFYREWFAPYGSMRHHQMRPRHYAPHGYAPFGRDVPHGGFAPHGRNYSHGRNAPRGVCPYCQN